MVELGRLQVTRSLIETTYVAIETGLKALRHVLAQQERLLDEQLRLVKLVVHGQTARELVAQQEELTASGLVKSVERRKVTG